MQIKRTSIPYKGRSRWGWYEGASKARKSTSVYTSGGGSAGGNGINITPTGTASCIVDVSSSYIYDDALPVTVSMNVIGEVENQRVPTYVQTAGITGGYPSMTISVVNNGTDHAVLNVTLPSGFNRSGKLTIPVLVSAATGQNLITAIPGQTMEQAFTSRTRTTKSIDCYWEYSILHQGADGTITRGPTLWTPDSARTYYSGTPYLDLIKRAGDRNTYKCITSYTQTAGQTWDQVSANWQVDNSFDVIAGGLVMGTDAAIELREDNQIVVYDDNEDDVVTIDSSGISSNRVFSREVTSLGLTMKDGSLNTTATIASSGAITTVGTVRTTGAVISTSVETGSVRSNDITAVGTVTASGIVAADMESGGISLKDNGAEYASIGTGGLSIGTVTTSRLKGDSIAIVGDAGAQYGTLTRTGGLRIGSVTTNGLTVRNASDQARLTVSGNGDIVTSGSVQATALASGTVSATGYMIEDPDYPKTYATVTRNNLGLGIAFVTDKPSYFDIVGDKWTFNGVDLHADATVYPYLDKTSDDEYVLVQEPGLITEDAVRTGVYTSQHARTNGRIYFDIDGQDITVGATSFTRGGL